MDKQELLAAVSELAATREISEAELIAAYHGAVPQQEVLTRRLHTADILYYIGGAIVFLGIAILVGQNWSYLSGFAKILLTLGTAVGFYIAGLLLVRDERMAGVGYAFFIISALLSPLGVSVTFSQGGVDIYTAASQTVISAILFAFYLGSYYLLKKNIFLLFSVFFGTWLFLALTQYLVATTPFWDSKFTEYRILVVGLCYMLLGYQFSQSEDKRPLSGVLYGFGSLGFLGTAMALQGFSPNENVFWEVIYPFLTLGLVLLSVRLRSRSFLVFGSLFLMGYILKITGEYFADSFGWPVALVIAGFGLIAVGWMIVYLRRRYMAAPPTPPAVPTPAK